MSLQLNPVPEIYKEFYGRNVDQMPKLIAEARVPLSVAGLLEAKLKHGKDLPDWMDSYFDTGDAVVYHPDGRIKIDINSKNLRKINLESWLSGGALILNEEVYNTIQGQEFVKSEIEKYTGKALSKKEVKSNPLWRALVNDQNLLNEATDFIFKEIKDRFGYNENMGLYLRSASDAPELRAWYVNRLYDRSDAVGIGSLGVANTRLVGVGTEGAEDSKK